MHFYGFCQTVWMLTGIPLNFTYVYLFFFFLNYTHIIYQYCIATNFSCCCLEEFHLVLLLATTSLGFEKDLTMWMFTIWESLFSDHKSESWIPCHIYLYCIFSKNSAVLKTTKYCFHKNVLYLQDILLTCNIWKHLCWNHFHNLVAPFKRVQRQKNFVILSGFWSLRGCGGGNLSEYIKICDKNVAVII